MNINLSEVPTDLILNLLNILILFLIVRFLVYKPVRNFMQKRADGIAETEQQAKNIMTEAENLKESYTRKLQDADIAARDLVAAKTAEAEAQAQAILDAANAEKEQIRADAEQRASADYDKKLGQMKDDVVQMACRISGSILSREMNAQDYEKLAEGFFDGQTMESTAASGDSAQNA